MKKFATLVLVVLVALSGLFLAGSYSAAQAKQVNILEFGTMIGVPPAFTGAQNPIRGINGGGLPWMISSAQGELSSSGHLEINVQGLVFAAGPNSGSNTIPAFRAIVSCLTSAGAVQNIQTGTFPATLGPASQGGGDAKIEADLALPQPCIAPLVFVTSPTGAWFATTGH